VHTSCGMVDRPTWEFTCYFILCLSRRNVCWKFNTYARWLTTCVVYHFVQNHVLKTAAKDSQMFG